MMSRTISTKTFLLNNGRPIPAVGLGTWQGAAGTQDEAALESSVIHALASGYRLIDTAQSYGVEHIVGRAIRQSGVPRSEITLITKFWSEWHHDPGEALRISLENLGTEYVDVFLMHWPQATTPGPEIRALAPGTSPTYVETWKMMEGLVGPRCRAIGVSNFTQKTLDELLSSAKVVPAVNQVEVHALNPNHKLVPYCESKGIHVMSWGTLGGDSEGSKILLTHDRFTSIAEAHGCSAGIISLSWAVQRGMTVIPKSGNRSRIEDNLRLVTLTEDEMASVNSAYRDIVRRRTADTYPNLYLERDGKQLVLGWTASEIGWEDEEGNWLV